MKRLMLIFLGMAYIAYGEAGIADRTTVRGVVTFGRSGDRWSFVQMEDGRCCRLGLMGGERAYPGEIVEATGDVTMHKPDLRLESVKVKHIGKCEIPARKKTTIAKIYKDYAEMFGLPVEVTARVLDVNRRRTQLQLYVCDLNNSNAGATASFLLKEGAEYDHEYRPGAIVCIKACPSMALEREAQGGGYIDKLGLTLNILSPDDIVILNRSPWWTPVKISIAVAFAALLLLASIGWGAAMTAKIRRERHAASAIAADRRRIADDLHDNMQQLLAGAMFRLDAARSSVGDPIAAARQIAAARKAIEYSQAGLRSVLWGLQGAVGGNLGDNGPAGGIVGLLRYASSRMPHWDGVVSISAEGEESLRLRRHGARLLMILQEAVGNALNHGHASKIDVRLKFGKKSLVMTIVDNGCGFTLSEAGRGLGLASMKRRAEEIGGMMRIESAPGKGATVTVEVNHG